MVDRLKRLSLYIFLGLLAYMPFHIFLSTWAGTSLNMLEFTKIFKDIVLASGFLLTFAISVRQSWFKSIFKDKLLWLILGYGGLTILIALIKPTDQDAEILGIVYNTRFLLFFIYGLLLGRLFESKWLIQRAVQVVLGMSVIVLFFGIVQYAILPDSALKHVGYARENGVLPAFFIDDKPNLERAMSTLRDPNSFGSYILITLSLGLVFLLNSKRRETKKVFAGILILSVLALWLTFSRSAWLGAILVVLAVFALSSASRELIRKHKKLLTVSLVTLLCVVAAGGFVFRNSYFVQNVVLHADESTVLEDPNQLRTRFFRESVENIANEPLGHGPGTAGLASIRNNVQGTTLNENYYLQIGYEVGIIGLILFLSILGVVAIRLMRIDSVVALGLLASFTGLLLTNFLVHIWSNEVIAYTWWGLAGLVLSQQSSPKQKGKTA